MVFASEQTYIDAGSPVGGIFPVDGSDNQWYITLPGGALWNPWRGGWTITGVIPAQMTIKPSIRSTGYGGGYHGYLTDGILCDDID